VGIVVACRCGQAFEADVYLAGKVVQCPACHSPIAVPTPADEIPAPTYAPRPRTGVSREEKETNESMTTILLVGGVLLVAVVAISIVIVGYLRETDPMRWVPQIPGTPDGPGALPDEKTGAKPAEQVATPVPIAIPNTSSDDPVVARAGLPEGWGVFEHSAGKFSALLPAAPENRESSIENLRGTQTTYALAVTQDEHLYEATREYRNFAIERGQEAAAYAAFLKRRAAEMEEGRIEASNNAIVDGRLVCDAILRGKVEGTEFRKYVRLIADGDSIFELSCRTPPGKERSTEIKLFLGNYQLQ
jgi:hypothetical protein